MQIYGNTNTKWAITPLWPTLCVCKNVEYTRLPPKISVVKTPSTALDPLQKSHVNFMILDF